MPSKVSRFNDEDPLTKAIAPPPDETIPQREARLIAEQNAKRVSDAIDEELNRQRLANKKATKPIKILLLGQLHSFLLTFHSPSPLPPRSERIRYFFFPPRFPTLLMSSSRQIDNFEEYVHSVSSFSISPDKFPFRFPIDEFPKGQVRLVYTTRHHH